MEDHIVALILLDVRNRIWLIVELVGDRPVKNCSRLGQDDPQGGDAHDERRDPGEDPRESFSVIPDSRTRHSGKLKVGGMDGKAAHQLERSEISFYRHG